MCNLLYSISGKIYCLPYIVGPRTRHEFTFLFLSMIFVAEDMVTRWPCIGINQFQTFIPSPNHFSPVLGAHQTSLCPIATAQINYTGNETFIPCTRITRTWTAVIVLLMQPCILNTYSSQYNLSPTFEPVHWPTAIVVDNMPSWSWPRPLEN